MTSLKTFALCLLVFSLECSGIPAKALDETYWPDDAFLRDEVQHTIESRAINDKEKEISDTALQIWKSVEDLNVRYHGQTHKKEPLRLFTKDQRALRIDPFFKGLFHFYNVLYGAEDPCVRTTACKEAQKRFIDNISSQKNGPISILHSFLSAKGLFKGDYKAFKEYLQKIWFEPYNRTGGTVLDSSAFEHVFLGEITTNGNVTGLHNWMRIYDDELGGRFRLTENVKYFPTGKPFVADVKFTWNGYTKKQGTTFFMKKSPAVEIALYTLCFKVRPDKQCSITFGEGVVNVMTKPLPQNKNLIFTAYPENP